MKFREDGTFTITQFTDMHLQDLGEKDRQTLELCEHLIEWESPDLLVLTGDIVHAHGSKSQDPVQVWREFVSWIDGIGMPWMYVFGNHDAESVPYEAVAEIVGSSTTTLFKAGPAEISGWGNYAVTVQHSDTDSVAAVLVNLDSGCDNDGDLSGWGYVHADQVEWCRTALSEYRSDAGVTQLLFVHNPLPQYQRAWDSVPVHGHLYEGISFMGKEEGLFEALHETGASGVFCGHDHINDFDAELEGIRLVYGRYTGYNCYGKEGFLRGSRTITLRQGIRGLDTHIRLEDGSVPEQPLHMPENPQS